MILCNCFKIDQLAGRLCFLIDLSLLIASKNEQVLSDSLSL